MRPVATIATGFVVAFGALRFNGFDLLLDAAGWGMVAAGLIKLQRSAADSFSRAGFFAVAMACATFIAMFTSGVSSGSDRVADATVQVIGVVSTAGALVTVWMVVDAIIRRLRASGDTSKIALLDVLRWAVVGLGALGMLAGYGYAALGGFIAIAWFAAIVALVVVLYRSARLPCLSPAQGPLAG